MQQSRLFLALPEYISTPDGMEIDQEGNLILSCPNFAQPETSGCVVKIGKDKKVTKWFDTPVHPKTGKARNMGIVFGPDGSLYLCDNQGWSGEEELAFQGRVLRVKADKDGIREWSVVADGMEHPNGAKIKDGYLYVTQSCMTKLTFFKDK